MNSKPKTMATNNGNMFIPQTHSQIINTLLFETLDEAEIIERLYSMSAGQLSTMSDDDFVNSIPFLFRMYGIKNKWTNDK